MLKNPLAVFSSESRQLKAARAIAAHLAEVLDARVSVRLWDGSVIPMGKDVEPGFVVSLSGPGVIGSLLRRPSFETVIRLFATGQIELHGADLIRFAEVVRARGPKEHRKKVRKLFLLRNSLPFLFAPAEKPRPEVAFAGDDVGHRESRRNNKDYIQFHYDVGNDFYKLFLDPEMQYSCGYFTDWNNSLAQAQHDKMEMSCRKLRLQPGERLLDIGCGWGGLICHAARNYGVQAHGVTLSAAQLEFAKAKIARLGLQDRVTVELTDYATLTGTYDKIVSVGMYEHVGIANYPRYFGKILSLLRDRGILLNHGITRAAKPTRRSFLKRRPEHKFVSKYIFPGGELDSIGHTLEVMEGGGFEIHDVENWREHYQRTTAFWCRALTAGRDEAIRMVGLERYNLWIAYLGGFSLAFADGSMRIHQVVATRRAKRGTSGLPPTCADLYQPNPSLSD